jgi:hypothetical protein
MADKGARKERDIRFGNGIIAEAPLAAVQGIHEFGGARQTPIGRPPPTTLPYVAMSARMPSTACIPPG